MSRARWGRWQAAQVCSAFVSLCIALQSRETQLPKAAGLCRVRVALLNERGSEATG